MDTIVSGLTTVVASAETERQWAEMFFGLDQGHRFILLLVAIGCLTGIIIAVVASISRAASRIHHRRTLVELKRDMVSRGMSADEIAKVLELSAPEDGGVDRVTASWHKGTPQ